MMIVKTAIRVVVTCVAGFAGVAVAGDFIAPAATSSLPDDWRWPLHSYISLTGGVVASLLACLLLFRTAGISFSRRILCILLSPAVAALAILLFFIVVEEIKIVHPWEGLALLILWLLVIPICSLVGFHLPIWMAAKNGCSGSDRKHANSGSHREKCRSDPGIPLMTPPIFVYEPNDLLVFESVDVGQGYLEPPDVLDGIYSAYDSEGRLLKLALSDNQRRVVIQPAESEPQHARELAAAIIAFLSAVGISKQWLGLASLSDLVKKALEYKSG